MERYFKMRRNFRPCVTTYAKKENENNVVKKTNVDEVYLKFKCQESHDMLSSLNQVKLVITSIKMSSFLPGDRL